MWIARDKDGRLYVYNCKPHRRINDFSASSLETQFPIKQIDKNLFPEITFENSPKELILKWD